MQSEVVASIVATGNDVIEIPLCSLMLKFADQCKEKMHPWDLLQLMRQALESSIEKESIISPDATVLASSILSGPCMIEEGAYVDDFCKIKGPAYIGKKCKIGTGSLIRNCIIGPESTVGFNCEIGRSYLAGKNKIAHHNVILDSIIGKGTWMGGYVGTTNILLSNQNVKYREGINLVDTGRRNFGAVIGANCAIGAGVIILPGRYIPPNSQIQAGTLVSQ